jgi:hypothetical protein
MFNITIGYDVIEVYKPLTLDDVEELLKDFKEYQNKNDYIRISNEFKGEKISTVDNVEYIYDNNGISWRIERYLYSKTKRHNLVIKINLDKFIGVKDCAPICDNKYLKDIEEKYNAMVSKISPALKRFHPHYMKGINYCVDFNLSELNTHFDAEQIAKLIDAGKNSCLIDSYSLDNPMSFLNYERDIIIKSCYIKVDCLWKSIPLKVIDPENPVPRLKDIIRFEVYHSYPVVFHSDKQRFCQTELEIFTSDIAKNMTINFCFRVIPSGDFYTIKDAISRVWSYYYRNKRDAKRTSVILHLINRCGSINEAQKQLNVTKIGPILFNTLMERLDTIGVNPVTIPDDWGIKFIPNLIYIELLNNGIDKYDCKL